MALSKEEKQQLKSDRVKSIFVETTRDMIHSEGIGQVSVRKIADRSGYSLGTVYNHFKNLDELLWMTRDKMLREMAEYLENEVPTVVSEESLSTAMVDYAKYYMKYRNVFKFFFFHHLNSDDKQGTTVVDEQKHQQQVQQTIELIMKLRNCQFEDALLLYRGIIYLVHGMLMMLISDNDGVQSESLEQDIRKSVKLILSQ